MFRLTPRTTQVIYAFACVVLAVAVYGIAASAWREYRSWNTYRIASRALAYRPAHDIRDSCVLEESLYKVVRAAGRKPAHAPVVMWISDAVTCFECAKGARTWVAMARDIAMERELEVWVAITAGEEPQSVLIKALAGSGLPLRVVSVLEPVSCAVRTGIHLAPTALLVSGNAVRCGFVGVPVPDSVQECLRSLRYDGDAVLRVSGGTVEAWPRAAPR